MTKYIVLILIITFTHITVNGQQQKINNNYQKSYIDSAIFYFNKAKTPNGIDSLAFKKGLDIISKIAIDDNAIKRIQNTSKEFIGIEKSRFYTTIEITLYKAIVSS